MQIDRKIAHAPRAVQFGQVLGRLVGPCIGCEGCTGLCPALIEALTLPDAILREAAE